MGKTTNLKHTTKNVTNEQSLSEIGRKSQVVRGKFCVNEYV